MNEFLIFHTTAELFSIIIACGIFMFAWNSRHLLENNYLLMLGVSYLFVGFIDLLHAFSYKGMNLIPGIGADPATQLWLLGRYMESLTLMAAPFFLDRRVRPISIFSFYLVVTLFLLAALFVWGLIPVAYVEGVGLTPFKKYSEYVICLALASAVIFLYRERHKFDNGVFRLLLISLLLTIAAELFLTLYVSVYGLSNVIGHLLKIASFYLIYRAIIKKGILTPYKLLFRNLQESKTALEKSDQQYRELFNSMISGFAIYEMIWDVNHKPIDFLFSKINPAFEKLTGLNRENTLGRRAKEILPELEPYWLDIYGEIARTGCPRHFENYSHELDRHFEVFAFRAGKDLVALTFNDVTERRRMNEALKKANSELELRVDERTRELTEANRSLDRQREILQTTASKLEQSNRELKDFAFVASHDLQEPLRKIQTFSDLLCNSHVFELNDNAKDYLLRMRRVADRMRHMIRSMLAYSRWSEGKPELKPVCLDAVLGDIKADLSLSIETCGASVLIDSLPVIDADADQMYQLFQNLITNAIKFRGNEAPVIKVYSEACLNGICRIFVEDNGIGFKDEHKDMIFRPFQRLHSKDAYEGTGIGLTICHKIVKQHGGTITAKSEPGKGTVFIVSLPTKQTTAAQAAAYPN